ncbi:MAG: hypothetical protein MUF14_06305 [Hyphomonadaceae bacterium]|nr:hypothetical protein [Hyphomonadaceae bacterium]
MTTALAPHQAELDSLQLQPVSGTGPTYRLIWHAWHRRPGALTLSCTPRRCTAELRYTDGYGTYRQGTLARTLSKTVDRVRAEAIIETINGNGLFALKAYLPVGTLYNRPELAQDSPQGANMICLHAPSYFVEAVNDGRTQLAYRFCQEHYSDGLDALKPMIDLFGQLFPDDMSQVSAYSNLEADNHQLRKLD